MSSQLPPAIYRERVKVRLKWFNQSKGFGFVQVEDEDKDAFLHASLVGTDQVSLLLPGTTLLCDLAKGQRGLIIATVYEIDPSTANPDFDEGARGHRRFEDDDEGGRAGKGQPYEPYTGPTETVTGIVKFYNSGKGYGFLQPDTGGVDVFLPGRIMQAAGLGNVQPDMRLRVEVREGPKGMQAEAVEAL